MPYGKRIRIKPLQNHKLRESIANFGQALLAAVVITILGYVIESALGRNISPYGRGIVGFLVSAVVLYVTKFIVPGFNVSIIGALIAAFLIGLVDIFVPTRESMIVAVLCIN